MSKPTKIIISFAIVLIVGWMVYSAVQGPEQGPQEPIKIGVIFPLTGKDASTGELSADGIKLAAEEINEQGGVNGKQVELIIEDSRSSAKDAVSAFQKLKDIDKVRIIIGGQTSTEAAALAPAAQESKILFLATTATTDKIDKAGDYVFKLQEGNSGHARLIASLIKEMGYQRLGTLAVKNEYCTDMMKYFNEEIKKQNVAVAAREQYEDKATDFRTQLTKVKSVTPQAVFLCGYYQDGGLVMKQARDLGITQQFFGVTTLQNPDFIKSGGKATEGIIYTTSPVNCTGATASFCGDFKAKYNAEPDYRPAYAYDALFILKKAIERAQSTDPERLKSELLAVEHTGVSGLTRFDADGNATKMFVLRTVKDGQFVDYVK